MGSYLLQTVTAAILCSIVITLTGGSNFVKPIQFFTGLIMVIIVMKPIVNAEFDIDILGSQSILKNSYAIVAQGEETAKDALAAVITDSVAAYIQDKAQRLGTAVTVQVEVTDGIPTGVMIAGNIPPYARSQLSQWIASELGIPEEEQHWG